MGTWGEAERLVQPTDPSVWSVFVFLRKEARGPRGGRAWHPRVDLRGFRQMADMKARILRLTITFAAIAATAMAGGAGLKGF